MDPIRPYLRLIGWCIAIALLTGFGLLAYRKGVAAQRGRDEGRIETLRASLREAADALSADASAFRRIDVQAKDNARLADQVRQQAEREAKAARGDTAALARQITDITRQAERERASCPQAEMPICGSPLR